MSGNGPAEEDDRGTVTRLREHDLADRIASSEAALTKLRLQRWGLWLFVVLGLAIWLIGAFEGLIIAAGTLYYVLRFNRRVTDTENELTYLRDDLAALEAEPERNRLE